MRSSLQAQFEQLRGRGYVVVPGFVPIANLARLNHAARVQLAARASPLEFEADLRYPGAPQSHTAEGGDTIRRLLDAFHRDPQFAESSASPSLREWLEGYFGEPVLMSCVHHNCLMTKHPQYGSMTGWHRDIRYWSFEQENLISVWLALGAETVDNGALWFVPGSHAAALEADRFDAKMFFRADRADNTELLRTAQSPRLAAGDAVFFHCNTLHSAGKNLTDDVKFSLVYTYHGCSNAAKSGTRSASRPEIPLRREDNAAG
jgi:phytanoyl-CoA hydroxylase